MSPNSAWLQSQESFGENYTLRYNGKPICVNYSNPDDSPIGTIISFMGIRAPQGYVICDGSVYDISDCSPNDCPLLPRVEALERDSEHNKEAHKEFYGKLEGSHTAVALIEERMSQIKEDTEEIKESVREMKDKPARRWESLVEKTVWAVCAAVIAFLLGRVGL